MLPIGSITIGKDGNVKERIGNNKRSSFSSSSVEVERLILSRCPIAVSFDVAPFPEVYYFQEFTYFDLIGGALLATQSSECNASIVEMALDGVSSPDYSLMDKLLANIGDKYNLSTSFNSKVDTVMFMPGSNLMHCVDRGIMDTAMFKDETAVIKPHPITRDETLAGLGRNYGYSRVISPNESGIAILKRCSKAYIPSNSEFGVISAAIKKPFVDMTAAVMQPKLSYSPIYRLFKDLDVEHNYEVLAKLLTSKSSGLVFSWMDDVEARIDSYYNTALEFRKIYKPKYAGTLYKYNFTTTPPAHG